jgi:hypothetical protein
MRDRGFTHPNFGMQARIEQAGKEVRIVFVAGTELQAISLAESILSQMKAGAINITMMGKPTSVEESSK